MNEAIEILIKAGLFLGSIFITGVVISVSAAWFGYCFRIGWQAADDDDEDGDEEGDKT